MIRTYDVDWSDLTYEKQQDILEDVKAQMLENIQEEAEKKRAEFAKTNKEWADIDWHLISNEIESWCSFDSDVSDEDKISEIGLAIESHIDKKADQECWRGFKYLQGEVEI